jgi:hypothetical protein
MNNSRAYTKEEMCKMFLDQCKSNIDYWSKQEDLSTKEMCEGLVHSIFCIIDGSTAFPSAINLVLDPHPDDKDYYISEGENWVEAGQVINDEIMLHEHFYK